MFGLSILVCNLEGLGGVFIDDPRLMYSEEILINTVAIDVLGYLSGQHGHRFSSILSYKGSLAGRSLCDWRNTPMYVSFNTSCLWNTRA
jgi:hypothetical protein